MSVRVGWYPSPPMCKVFNVKGSVHEKSSRVMWHCTYSYIWEISTLGPAEAINSRKSRFVNWKYIYRRHLLFFRSFAALTNLNRTGPADSMSCNVLRSQDQAKWPLFFCLNSQETFEKQIRGEIHPIIKIQVSCHKNQSSLGSSSTILLPINEVRGRKNCLNSQEAKFLTVFEQHFSR